MVDLPQCLTSSELAQQVALKRRLNSDGLRRNYQTAQLRGTQSTNRSSQNEQNNRPSERPQRGRNADNAGNLLPARTGQSGPISTCPTAAGAYRLSCCTSRCTPNPHPGQSSGTQSGTGGETGSRQTPRSGVIYAIN